MAEKQLKLFTPKYIAFLIIPLLIEQVLSMTIGMADTIMVAGVGEEAVSGIALVDSISILLIILFSSFGTGGAVIVSQYIGKNDYKKANIAAKGLMELTVLISVFILAIGLVGNKALLRLIFGNVSVGVLDNADTYFIYILLSYPFLGIINSSNALFRSMGKSSITMFVSFIINIINISGNAILIFGYKMGAQGAGIASLASRIVGAIILLFFLANKKALIHIDRMLHFEWDSKIFKRIINIAVPAGLEGSIFQLGKILVQSLIASFGTASITANATVNNICGFANIPGAVIGLASITIIGQCCGAKKFESAMYYGKQFLLLSYVIMAITCIFFYFATPFLVSFYNLSQEGTELAIYVNRLCLIWTLFIWPLAFTVPNFVKATGNAKYPMVVSISCMWLFRIGFSYFLGRVLNLGLVGAMYGMFFDWIFRSIFFTHYFFKGKKWFDKEIV